MKISNLAEANAALHDYMPQVQSTNWTFALEQMEQLMADLGNPQDTMRVIHVAGTSGKTSTCYYLADMLKRSGKKVGLTVSPHVDWVNERVQIDGVPLEESTHCQMLSQFLELPAVQKAQPSYFGVLVAFAFWVFAKEQVEYAVVEVGLGGRLDATNVVHRADKVCVITDIGIDHTEFLGKTIDKIAGEKAGIIHTDNVVYMAPQDVLVTDAIQKRAQQVGAELRQIVPRGSATLHLPGFQKRNWQLARVVVDYVADRDGFRLAENDAMLSAQTSIPGRMETIFQDGNVLIMDGAHNGQKISALCTSLAEQYPGKKIAAVVSFAKGKDDSVADSMQALQPVVDELIITTFTAEQDVPKTAIDPEQLAQAATAAGINNVTIIEDPHQAFQQLLKSPAEISLIAGSFYLLNHIRPLVKERQHD